MKLSKYHFILFLLAIISFIVSCIQKPTKNLYTNTGSFAENSLEEPYKVIPVIKELDKSEYQGSYSISLPKHSLVIIEFSET